MNTIEFLNVVRSQGARVWAVGGTLHYSTPSAFPPALLDELRERKHDILATLADTTQSAWPVVADAPPRDAAGTPASFAQQQLWILHQIYAVGAAYHLSFTLRLGARIDVDVLQAALRAVARRHDALRTTFHSRDGELFQVVEADDRKAVDFQAVADVPAARLPAAMARRAAAAFDLASLPLLRATLFGQDDGPVLLVTVHHMVFDAWSQQIFVRELEDAYWSLLNDRHHVRAPLPLQYADFARWQRTQLDASRLAPRLAHWTQRLQGLKPLQLPFDHPRPPVFTFHGQQQAVHLPAALVGRAEALARRHDATLYMVLLAGFGLLLGRLSGQDDLAVGAPVAGRSRSEFEGLIGFFANVLVMRADLSGDPGFDELVRRTRRTTLEAFAHQDVPFERLVEAMRPERDVSRNPLVQVVFQLLQFARPADLQDAAPAAAMPGIDMHASPFDLSLTLWPGPDGLAGVLLYSSDLFDTASMALFAARYRTVLENALARPDLPVRRLPLLGDDELTALHRHAHGHATPPAAPATVLDLWEAQALAHPQALAVSAPDGVATHAELHARAEGLADELRARGIGPDARVGLCLERSLALATGLLAVLKAGAAYVPLDPAHGDERLAFMIGDAGCRAILAGRVVLDRLAPLAGPEVALLTVDPEV